MAINETPYGVRAPVSSKEYDFAFVARTYTTDTISRAVYNIAGKTLMANAYAHAVQGTVVGRTGMATGYNTGKVLYVIASNALGKDLIVTDCKSKGGDSGGPYFVDPSSSTPTIAGIHIGSWDALDTHSAYYRDVQYIRDAGIQIE